MKNKILCLFAFLFVGALLYAFSGSIWHYIVSKNAKPFTELTYGEPAYKSIHGESHILEQTAIIQIGDRTFEIPKIYIQTHLEGDGPHKMTGLNLLYVMPNFTSRHRLGSEEAYQKAFQEKRLSHMLIRNIEVSTPISQIVQNRKDSGKMTLHKGREHGLERYVDDDDPRHLNLHYDDTYVDMVGDEVFSYLECSSEKAAVPSPGCNHHFDDKGLRFDIHYNKEKYLFTWKEHRLKAIDFVNSFEINTNNSEN